MTSEPLMCYQVCVGEKQGCSKHAREGTENDVECDEDGYGEEHEIEDRNDAKEAACIEVFE